MAVSDILPIPAIKHGITVTAGVWAHLKAVFVPVLASIVCSLTVEAPEKI